MDKNKQLVEKHSKVCELLNRIYEQKNRLLDMANYCIMTYMQLESDGDMSGNKN